MKNGFKILTFVASFLLILFSALYYMERTIMYDSSYYLFNLVVDKTFCIQHFRYGALFTQLIPLGCLSQSCSLQHIALSYSINVNLIVVILALWSGFGFKNWRAAAAIVICPFLFNAEMFFWMVAEAQFLSVFWLFIYAFIHHSFGKPITVLRIATLLLLLFFGLTIHPLSVFCFVALCLFLIISQKYTEPIFLLTLLFAAVVMLLKTKVLAYSSYDRGAMSHVVNFKKLFPHYFNLPVNRYLLSMFFNKMLFIPILLFGAIGLWWYQRKYFAAMVYAALVCGFLFFTNICFYTIDNSQSLYLENLYQPLAFMLIAPFVFLVQKSVKTIWVLSVFISCVVLGSIRIVDSSAHYTARLQWERTFLANNTTRKVIIHSSHTPINLIGQPWCTPFEFALLSSMENMESYSHFVTHNVTERPNNEIALPNGIVQPFGWIAYASLPKQYFHFTDTIQGYTVIPEK